jgi:hypothetical protein
MRARLTTAQTRDYTFFEQRPARFEQGSENSVQANMDTSRPKKTEKPTSLQQKLTGLTGQNVSVPPGAASTSQGNNRLELVSRAPDDGSKRGARLVISGTLPGTLQSASQCYLSLSGLRVSHSWGLPKYGGSRPTLCIQT